MKKAVLFILVVAAVVGSGVGYMYKQTGHLAYLAIPVLTDREWVKTDIHLQVTHERVDLPLQAFLRSDDPVNAPLIELFRTITSQSVREIRQLLHPGVFQAQQAQNVTNFIQGLIENYARMEDLTVERRFKAGDEVVFIITGTLGPVHASSPMRFSSFETETPRYIPFGLNSPSIAMIEAWSRGRMREWDNYPVIEFPQSLEKYFGLAYRVPLVRSGEPATLAFNGEVLLKENDDTGAVGELFNTLAEQSTRRDWPAILALHTAGSRKYLEKAFRDRSTPDYVDFVSGLSDVVPYFYIDGGGVAVVFSGYRDMGAYTLNYVAEKDGELKITNAGVVPLSYHVFADERVMKGMKMDPPFTEMKVN